MVKHQNRKTIKEYRIVYYVRVCTLIHYFKWFVFIHIQNNLVRTIGSDHKNEEAYYYCVAKSLRRANMEPATPISDGGTSGFPKRSVTRCENASRAHKWHQAIEILNDHIMHKAQNTILYLVSFGGGQVVAHEHHIEHLPRGHIWILVLQCLQRTDGICFRQIGMR